MRILVLASLLAVAFAGCTESDDTATMHVFIGDDSEPLAITITSTYPSEAMYDDTTGPHPGFFTGIDLLEVWSAETGHEVVYQYFEGMGFFASSISGTPQPGESAYWAVGVDGEASAVGLGDVPVVDGMAITLELETY